MLIMDLALNNGQVFYKGKLRKLNIGVAKGKIKKISKKAVSAKNEIDCRGKVVLPGAIDVHVHFRDFNEKYKADWQSESKAALHGGVTTVMDMPNNKNFTTTTKQRLLRKIKHIEKNSLVNFGVYFGLGEGNLGKLRSVKGKCCGYKLYMCETTGDLLLADSDLQENAFKAVAKTGKILVTHAESQGILDLFRAVFPDADNAGKYSKRRPDVAEAFGVAVATDFADFYGTKLHLTHLSSAQGVKIAGYAKKRKVKVSCDTTHTYLFLTEKDTARKKGFAKVNPAPKSEQDRKGLWKAVRKGGIDCIATDHAPHTIREKKKKFSEAPAGLPSLDFYLPMLLNEVNKGKLSLKRVVELCCGNPARIFGVKGKGDIRKGFDADLVIVDMKKKQKITRGKLFTKPKWSPYGGMKLKGAVEKTIVNGKIVFDGKKFDTRFKGKMVLTK